MLPNSAMNDIHPSIRFKAERENTFLAADQQQKMKLYLAFVQRRITIDLKKIH